MQTRIMYVTYVSCDWLFASGQFHIEHMLWLDEIIEVV